MIVIDVCDGKLAIETGSFHGDGTALLALVASAVGLR